MMRRAALRTSTYSDRLRARTPAATLSAGWMFGAAITLWIACETFAILLAPPPAYSEGVLLDASSPLQRAVQYAGAVVLILAAGLQPRSLLQQVQAALQRNAALLCVASATALTFVASLAKGHIMGAAYSAVLALALAVACGFWSLPERTRIRWIRRAMWVCVLFGLLSVALYWPPRERWMGGMHPNIFSFPLVFAAIAALVYAPRARLLIVPGSLFLCTAVSSRYAMISIALVAAAIAYLALRRRLGDVYAALLLITVCAALGFVFQGVIIEALLLNDQTRGLAGGATGRADLTASALGQIAHQPLLGYGFRAREAYEGAHNGLVNIVIEVGIPIAALLFTGIIIQFVATARGALSRNDDARHSIFVFALLLACCFSAYFQPQLINFGDMQGVSLIIALAYSVTRSVKPATLERNTPALRRSLRGLGAMRSDASEGTSC